MENNPRKVFYRLFGQGDTSAERREIIDETGSILDFVMAKASSLQQRLGGSDRAMLNDYLDSVREVERRIQKMSAGSTTGITVSRRAAWHAGGFRRAAERDVRAHGARLSGRK